MFRPFRLAAAAAAVMILSACGGGSSSDLAPPVVVDGKLVTGQNQQSASEYGIVLLHAIAGRSPVSDA